jgi:hypothetical protein
MNSADRQHRAEVRAATMINRLILLSDRLMDAARELRDLAEEGRPTQHEEHEGDERQS